MSNQLDYNLTDQETKDLWKAIFDNRDKSSIDLNIFQYRSHRMGLLPTTVFLVLCDVCSMRKTEFTINLQGARALDSIWSIFTDAVGMFNNDDKTTCVWFRSPNSMLNGNAPIYLAGDPEDSKKVLSIIRKI